MRFVANRNLSWPLLQVGSVAAAQGDESGVDLVKYRAGVLARGRIVQEIGNGQRSMLRVETGRDISQRRANQYDGMQILRRGPPCATAWILPGHVTVGVSSFVAAGEQDRTD